METAALSIRRCSDVDAATLASLGARTFRETFDEFNTPANMEAYLSRAFTVSRLEEELTEGGSVFFLAEADGQPVGYAKVRTNEMPSALYPSKPLEIERIYVVKEQIGLGVGKKLMETCLAFARSHQHDIVWLGVWERNEPAKQFYARWGFEKFGQHVFMLGGDIQTDFLLKKQLR